jgi:transcriptional regulator with XRE-family HTH domain
MDTSVGQRIKSLLREYRFTQADLLKHLNWDIEGKKSTVSYWLRQTKDIPYIELLKGVLEVMPQVNLYWVLTGKGEKIIVNKSNPSNNHNNPVIGQESNLAYDHEKMMYEKQLNRVIEMLEKQITEKDKTINRLLNIIDDNKRSKES